MSWDEWSDWVRALFAEHPTKTLILVGGAAAIGAILF